ncbi:MAG: GNAT family N-acetyltransferase [Rhodospirillales bacterium]|nr:GNAT family N-acetyltransferase [Rhodospirillales bacterium]
MAEAVSMRLAQPEDGALAARIAETAYAEYLPVLDRPPVPVTDDHAARIAAGEMWIALRAGEPAGMLVLETEADHLAIFSIAILPAHQRQGLGQFMLDFAEQRARAAGLGIVRLYTNAKMVRNIAVYRRFGYAETGRRENPARPGWVIVDMEKRLA